MGPAIAAVAWLCFLVIQFGPTGGGAFAGKLILLVCLVTVALGVASGVYEPMRAFRSLRARLRRKPIDWNAFDTARADWERRKRR